MPEGVGGLPRVEGMEARFDRFCPRIATAAGVGFLDAAVSYVRDQLGLSSVAFLHEMVSGILACEYPTPPRMLKITEEIVRHYLMGEVIGGHVPARDLDLFAVEGGTAGITYVFNTMRENRLLVPGDKIAIGMPIFTPYIEIPVLDDYQLVEVNVNADAERGWQYSAAELDKLADPAVKAFFVVNPSNPPSIKIDAAGLRRIADIVAKKRPDLIILTDDVYGDVRRRFRLAVRGLPAQHDPGLFVFEIFRRDGLASWRHRDASRQHPRSALAALPEADKAVLDKRYGSLVVDPREIKFIDRLVADSRTVAQNHTAGLSTPQQVQMALFSLFLADGRGGRLSHGGEASHPPAARRAVPRTWHADARTIRTAPTTTRCSTSSDRDGALRRRFRRLDAGEKGAA